MFGIPEFGEREGHSNTKCIRIKKIYLLIVCLGLIPTDLGLCFP